MKAFTAFLKQAKQQKPVRIVIGNTSGDMDSIVGALVYSYYLSLKTKDFWTPIVNCHAVDFVQRVEIKRHFDNCHIDSADLVFLNDLVQPLNLQEIALFDHNQLEKEQAEYLGAHLVTYIMDHHVDNHCYSPAQLKYKNVKLIGSCCSILTQEIISAIDLFNDDFNTDTKINLAYLLGAPILLDTSNFAAALKDNQWTDEDTQAFEWL